MDGVTTTTCGGIKCMHVSEGKEGKECTVAFGEDMVDSRSQICDLEYP